MLAPAGKRYCAACARALRADGETSGPAAARSPWGVRQYLAVALLGGLGVSLVVGIAAGGKRRTVTMVPLTDPAPPAAAPVVPAHPQAQPDPADSIRAAARAQSSTLKPEQRAAAVRACVVGSACPQPQLDGIIAAGAHEREQEELRRLSHAWGAHVAAKGGTDGEQRSHIAVTAAALQLEECGIAELKKLDWTTQGEADKDIDGARGKMINAYGYVHQIRKDGDLHWGTMTTPTGWIYFVVVGQTKGVVAGRHAEIAGMVVQRYLYENAAGGRTDSILIVGRVRNQADSDKPLPPAPTAAMPSPRGTRSPAASPATSATRPSSTWDLPFHPPSSPEPAAAAAPAPQPPGRSPAVLDEAPPPPQAATSETSPTD